MAKIEKIVSILGMVVLFLLAGWLRTNKVGQVPAGFYADEAAIAYNGYSLLETGRDEYGKSWPALFRSFGEYKTPTYSYLLVPIFKIWGKSVVVARDLTVISGLLAIIGVMVLAKMWFKRWPVLWLSGLVLALMSWHILYSRSVYEVNLALTMTIWGVVCLESGLKKTRWNWAVGFGLLAMSIVTYNGARVVTPLLGLIWLILNRKEIFSNNNRKWVVVAVLVGLVCLWPVWRVVATTGFWERAGINIFNNGQGNSYDRIWEWASLLVAYFNPFYWFKLGDPGGRSSWVDLALMFGWQLPFIAFGWKRLEKESNRVIFWVVGWLLVAPVAASLTRDPMASIRSLSMVVPLSLLIGLGMGEIVEKYKNWGRVIIFGLFLVGTGRLYLSIFKMTDYYRFRDWDYGLAQVAREVKKIPENIPILYTGKKINYIQLAYFLAKPLGYIEDNYGRNGSDYYNTGWWPDNKKIGRVEVREIVWKEDIFKDQIIIFGELGLEQDQANEHCLATVFEIRGLDGKRIFWGVRTNPELKRLMGDRGCGE